MSAKKVQRFVKEPGVLLCEHCERCPLSAEQCAAMTAARKAGKTLSFKLDVEIE